MMSVAGGEYDFPVGRYLHVVHALRHVFGKGRATCASGTPDSSEW